MLLIYGQKVRLSDGLCQILLKHLLSPVAVEKRSTVINGILQLMHRDMMETERTDGANRRRWRILIMQFIMSTVDLQKIQIFCKNKAGIYSVSIALGCRVTSDL